MKEKLEALASAFQERFSQVTDEKTLQDLKVEFLGKKAEVTTLLKMLGTLPPDQRPIMGELINNLKQTFETAIAEKLQVVKEEEKARRLSKEKIDVTLPGRRLPTRP